MFNIQLFGTNDTITSSSYLQIEFGFNDGDSRKQNIPSPRSNLTSTEIDELNQWIASNQVVIGDKYGAQTTGINSAATFQTIRTKLDIS